MHHKSSNSEAAMLLKNVHNRVEVKCKAVQDILLFVDTKELKILLFASLKNQPSRLVFMLIISYHFECSLKANLYFIIIFFILLFIILHLAEYFLLSHCIGLLKIFLRYINKCAHVVEERAFDFSLAFILLVRNLPFYDEIRVQILVGIRLGYVIKLASDDIKYLGFIFSLEFLPILFVVLSLHKIKN